MDEQTYEIQDGVRRAKAAWLCGRETIAAQFDGLGDVFPIPISFLLSLKPVIEDSGPRGGSWGLIYRRTQRGQELPPIIIVPGTRGIPVAEVEVQADELELFRQRHSSDT